MQLLYNFVHTGDVVFLGVLWARFVGWSRLQVHC